MMTDEKSKIRIGRQTRFCFRKNMPVSLRARCYDDYIKALGRDGGVYVRVAGTTRLAHAFAYMNLIEHWESGIPRIVDKVKAAELREPEFIGGEVDLRINIYRGQVDGTVDLNDLNNAIKVPDTIDKMPNSGNIHYTK